MSLPKVLILYTGGTIGMEYRSERPDRLMPIDAQAKSKVAVSLPRLSDDELKKRLLQSASEIENLVHSDVQVVMNRDSANIGPRQWVQIAEKIKSQWHQYDGVVILHGTDTLPYTASALSFLLQPCLKPVVFTGAQRPLAALRTDARANLVSALEVCAYGPKSVVQQVSVVFGSHMFRGNSIRKLSITEYNAFESPLVQPLARIGTTIRYATPSARTQETTPVALLPAFSDKVMVLHLTPGFFAQGALQLLDSDIDAIVMVAFPSGTGPTHQEGFREFLDKVTEKDIPLIWTTQGTGQPPFDESQQHYYADAGIGQDRKNCYWAAPMTPECAYVKTSLILGQPDGKKLFSKYWSMNFAGEIQRS